MGNDITTIFPYLVPTLIATIIGIFVGEWLARKRFNKTFMIEQLYNLYIDLNNLFEGNLFPDKNDLHAVLERTIKDEEEFIKVYKIIKKGNNILLLFDQDQLNDNIKSDDDLDVKITKLDSLITDFCKRVIEIVNSKRKKDENE